MQKEQDDKHFIPIMDCPNCGMKDTPLSTKGPWVPRKDSVLYKAHKARGKSEEEMEIWISFCTNCEIVPEDESWIKGYISLEELEAMGWKRDG